MYWDLWVILILITSTYISYLAGLGIYRNTNPVKCRRFLVAGIILNLTLLFAFKYYMFTSKTINALFPIDIVPTFNILLPIGISFFILQSMSYIVDVYRKDIQGEANWGYLSLYLAFFPQLLAGPIERAGKLLPQLKKYSPITTELVMSGFKLILIGLFKKTVLADNLAVYSDYIFTNYAQLNGFEIILGVYLYSFQIYFDFSGYIDIAKGTAKLFNIDLSDNFNIPYFSTSVKDFWHRWHITLSQWFRDYVYISLGGKNTSNNKWIRNIIIVFILSGFWHGANWTFIVWGILHGIYYIINVIVSKYYDDHRLSIFRIPAFLKYIITFNLVSFAWIIFRSPSIEYAIGICQRLITTITFSHNEFSLITELVSPIFFFIIISLSIYTLYIEKKEFLTRYINQNSSRNIQLADYAFTNIVIISIIGFNLSYSRNFIYFQF